MRWSRCCSWSCSRGTARADEFNLPGLEADSQAYAAP